MYRYQLNALFFYLVTMSLCIYSMGAENLGALQKIETEAENKNEVINKKKQIIKGQLDRSKHIFCVLKKMRLPNDLCTEITFQIIKEEEVYASLREKVYDSLHPYSENNSKLIKIKEIDKLIAQSSKQRNPIIFKKLLDDICFFRAVILNPHFFCTERSEAYEKARKTLEEILNHIAQQMQLNISQDDELKKSIGDLDFLTAYNLFKTCGAPTDEAFISMFAKSKKRLIL